jgi:hypothetical protein
MPGFTGMGCGCCATGLACGTCTIPFNDLTLHWTNPILGDGSIALVWNGSTLPGGAAWASASCSNELLYNLHCASGTTEFQAIYFISGPCPSGTRQTCTNLRGTGNRLPQTSLTCGDGFDMIMSCTGTSCPVLSANGFTSFEVTNP